MAPATLLMGTTTVLPWILDAWVTQPSDRLVARLNTQARALYATPSFAPPGPTRLSGSAANCRFARRSEPFLEMFWKRHLPAVHASVHVCAFWATTVFGVPGWMRVKSRFCSAAPDRATSITSPVDSVPVTVCARTGAT